MVRVTQPRPGEVIQDPAGGTGGFIVAADHYIKERSDDLFTLSAAAAHFQRHQAFRGAELVPDAHRLCLMNLMLHGIDGSVLCADTLSPDGEQLAFVEHIVRALNPGGRAAVVVPDNVLFEDNTGRRLRTWLMELCDLHTILRLPKRIRRSGQANHALHQGANPDAHLSIGRQHDQ